MEESSAQAERRPHEKDHSQHNLKTNNNDNRNNKDNDNHNYFSNNHNYFNNNHNYVNNNQHGCGIYFNTVDNIQNNCNTEEHKIQNKQIIKTFQSAFHLALYNNNDRSAAHILNRILFLSCSNKSVYGNDASAVLDGITDKYEIGIKKRNEFVTYCCLTNNAHVLHILLSTYLLEWSIYESNRSVRTHVQELLLETAGRGHTAAAAVLLYHMHREKLVDLGPEIPEIFEELEDTPRRTYVVLKTMTENLRKTEGSRR